MSTHWKEPLDPTRHLDFMIGSELGGRPRSSRAFNPGSEWAYFVRVHGFTFEFASIKQIEECLAFCRRKVHESSILPTVTLEHYWQRWYERLPKGLLAGTKRDRVVQALERALKEFQPEAE